MILNLLDVSVCRVFVRLFFTIVLVVTGAVGMSAQVVEAEASKRADEFLAQWDKRDSAGCGVGVVRDGRLVHKRAFGMANLDFDAANTTHTKFNLASVSKAFTAFSILLLAEQGKLSLDDDIRKHLPEMPVYGEPITIRHLLSHTSGIREFEALVLFGGIPTDGPITDKAVMKMLTRQKIRALSRARSISTATRTFTCWATSSHASAADRCEHLRTRAFLSRWG